MKKKKAYLKDFNITVKIMAGNEGGTFGDDFRLMNSWTERWAKTHKMEREWEICRKNCFIFFGYAAARNKTHFAKIIDDVGGKSEVFTSFGLNISDFKQIADKLWKTKT